MTAGTTSPAMDVDALSRERIETLFRWAVLYQELGPASPLVAAEQDRLDDQARLLGHLTHETRYLAPVATSGGAYAGQ